MPKVTITKANLTNLEKWAEYFNLTPREALNTILATAFADLETGSPLFFGALDPMTEEDWHQNGIWEQEVLDKLAAQGIPTYD